MHITYKNNPIGSISALAKTLKITESELNELIELSNTYYFPNTPIPKSDGTFRQTYRVDNKLKKVLSSIVKNIFHHVYFPQYLQGSIKDSESPRDYIINASIHSNKKIVIKEDIKNFFPSIKSSHVEKTWRRLFRFPADVASALTKLTTYNNEIPQGAPTSSYIANVIFWDTEPNIVSELAKKQITYSRYIDDITISSEIYITKSEKTEIIKIIYGMFLKKGIKPNRKKHLIMKANEKMSVHGLNVNRKQPTLSKTERQKIRAAVYECTITHKDERKTEDYQKLYNKTKGRIHRFNRLHPSQAGRYINKLELIKPKST